MHSNLQQIYLYFSGKTNPFQQQWVISLSQKDFLSLKKIPPLILKCCSNLFVASESIFWSWKRIKHINKEHFNLVGDIITAKWIDIRISSISFLISDLCITIVTFSISIRHLCSLCVSSSELVSEVSRYRNKRRHNYKAEGWLWLSNCRSLSSAVAVAERGQNSWIELRHILLWAETLCSVHWTTTDSKW